MVLEGYDPGKGALESTGNREVIYDWVKEIEGVEEAEGKRKV
ncbi:hypothetical protein ACFLUU_02390 [Chloroflexota bacterium]